MTKEYKSGFVTLIGRPNVGKSTLMNRLIGQKIAITSNKPQTTRHKIQTVLTRPEGQIIFVDTPGIHKAQNKLGTYMVKQAKQTLNDVDTILWLVEPSTFVGENDRAIAEMLHTVETPVIVVINKIDMVDEAVLFRVMQIYKDLCPFAEIVPLCARSGQNADELLNVVFKNMPYGPMFYDEDTITDQPVRQIVAEIVREKALHCLDEEVPHGIAVMTESMKDKGRLVEIHATIVCERESHKGIIIGKRGQMIKDIGTRARYEIEKFLGKKVNLKLFVKVKKDWRDSEFLLKNFGYNEDE